MIPGLLVWMTSIRRHYHQVALEVAAPAKPEPGALCEPLVVVPVEEWNRVSTKALKFAMTMSRQVRVLHIESAESGELTDALRRQWKDWLAERQHEPGFQAPELVLLKSPYRVVVNPIVDYVLRVEREKDDRQVAVVLSELVEQNWFQMLLHNQRARVLSSILTRNGDQRIVVVNVPWYFRQEKRR
jgi:hypothetical protein